MSDNFQTIRCPACGNKMRKVFVPSAGVNVDICVDGCGGIYFDRKEIQHFQKGNDTSYNEIKKELAGKVFTPVNQNEIRVCPVCAAKMVKTKIQGLNIEIDTCYSCGGIFLDNEELELIRESMQKTPYQKAQEPNNNVQNGYSANLKMNDKLGSNGTSLRDFYRDAVREENKYDHHVAEFSDVFGLFFRRRGIWDLLDLFF